MDDVVQVVGAAGWIDREMIVLRNPKRHERTQGLDRSVWYYAMGTGSSYMKITSN